MFHSLEEVQLKATGIYQLNELLIVNILLENPEILPQNLLLLEEYLPIAPNSTREGRSANRRIEVILSPQLDKITQIINTLD